MSTKLLAQALPATPPGTEGMPAADFPVQLLSWVLFLVLVGCAAYLAWYGLRYAASRGSGAVTQARESRMGLVAAVIGAMAAGAAVAAINWAYGFGNALGF